MIVIKNKVKNYIRIILLSFSLMVSSFSFSQEICNNGIDDDGDGLIDLNDVASCTCTPSTVSVPSLIPNPSFETQACCPSSFSEVSCAQGWVQATDATSDYMNTCGGGSSIFPALTAAGLQPFPDGNGVLGCIFAPTWQEYVGSCLTSPMLAGTAYSVQMNVASTPIDDFGNVCNGGVINYSPINLTIYGAANCSSLPATGTGCPGAPWVVLGTTLYTPASTWGVVTINFTPPTNINAIIIGSPCTLPADYTYGPCYPYFYFDNMLLNTTASFTATIAQSGTWCSSNVQITGNPVAGATYQWYQGGVAIVGQTGLTLNVSALGLPAGVYQFVTTVSGTCAVASSTVVASGSITPVITAAGPFCANAAPVNLVADIAGGTWSGTGITNAGLGTFNPALATVGNNTITYTTSGGCPGVGTSTIVVNALPVTTVNSPTICAGLPATLTGAGATTYSWSTGAVINPISVSPLVTTTYTVTGTTAGCTSTAISTVTIAGSLPLTVNSPTICIGSTANIVATGATTYVWSAGATSTGGGNADATPLVTTSYTVTGTSAGCTGTVVSTVTVNPLPTANAGLDQTICNGSAASLSGTIGGSASSATWTAGGGVFTPSATTLNASYTPSAAEIAAGTATVTITTDDPTGPCSFVTDQMVITINPIATINAGPDQVICIGNTATMAGVTGGSATSGTWSGGAGVYAPSATTANAVYTPTVAEIAAGTVSLTFTSDDPIGPCAAVSDIMILTISPPPSANAGPSQSVCSGSNITLAGTLGGSASSGTWSGGAGTYAPSNTALNAVYTPSAAEYAAGYVILMLTTNDPAGPCTFDTASVIHHFYPNPVIGFSVNDSSGCPIHCPVFTDLSTVSGGASIVSWSWSFGDLGTGNTQNPSHCYNTTGVYDVTLTATSSQGCIATLTNPAMVEVFAMPIAQFGPSPNPATVLEPTMTMVNMSSSDVNYWFWDFGDGDTLAPNTSSPTHVYPGDVPNSFIVQLIVMNSDGCIDSVSHIVTIAPEYAFFIPNAFTPNGDGINDLFFGSGIGIETFDLYIFDRWGNLIFHGDTLSDKWDGKANSGSEIAQQDVYVWKVKLTDVFGKKHNYVGSVTLVK